MDLSKSFNCIPHDLLVAKLHAYGLSMDAVTFIYSYMKIRNQGVKINDTEEYQEFLKVPSKDRLCSTYLLMIYFL